MPNPPRDPAPSLDEPVSTVPAQELQRDEMIGRLVGSYRIVKLLGEGGMGAVYMGEHPAIGSKVAIKMLHLQFAAKQSIVDRFFNEAKAVNVIGHDNIVKILDFDVTQDGRHYFVMEFLHGQALQALVQPGGPLPLQRLGPIVLQCCKALQAAHERGIVHRDFKPDNVFLVAQGDRADYVKLVDFGIAKLAASIGGGMTQPGTVMGTPAYMSPEQAAGETMLDARSDIYSLGVTMFQMATGKLPFADAGPSFGKILVAHLQQPPPRPRTIHPDVPEELEEIILKTLEKKPEDRYQSMAELHDSLLGCMERLGISSERPRTDEVVPAGAIWTPRRTVSSVTPASGSTVPRAQRTQLERRRPGRLVKAALLGAGIVVAAAVATVLIPWPWDRPRPPDRVIKEGPIKGGGGGETKPPEPAPASPPSPEPVAPPAADRTVPPGGSTRPGRTDKPSRPAPRERDAPATTDPSVAIAESKQDKSAVYFDCVGAREVCGALRSAVDEALEKAGLRSVHNAQRAEIGVTASVNRVGPQAAQQFGTTFAVQTYSIDLAAEATRTSEAVSMPPSTTLSYDPQFGSERAMEKSRLVAGEIVEKVQSFIDKNRR
jgi:serine/threonine protein kinase